MISAAVVLLPLWSLPFRGGVTRLVADGYVKSKEKKGVLTNVQSQWIWWCNLLISVGISCNKMGGDDSLALRFGKGLSAGDNQDVCDAPIRINGRLHFNTWLIDARENIIKGIK